MRGDAELGEGAAEPAPAAEAALVTSREEEDGSSPPLFPPFPPFPEEGEGATQTATSARRGGDQAVVV